jgi:YVTN family beta-propeller protein
LTGKDEPKRIDLLLVLNKSENTGTFLDRSDGRLLATVVTGVAPHEVAVTSDGTLAVAANYGTRENPGSSLTLIDMESRKVVKTISLGKYRRPHGVQFFRDNRRVAVTVEGSQALIVVNLETQEVEKVIRTRQVVSHMVVMSADEQKAFVTNLGSGTVSVIDLPESRLVMNLATGDGAEGLDISPDGTELWVANRGEDTIAIVDTDTLELVEKLECASFPIRVKFTPDGEHVLVSNARTGDVAVFSAHHRREVRRIPMELSAKEQENRLLQFDLSPVPIGIVIDRLGEKAYVANSNADIISVIDMQTWSIVARLQAGIEPDGMALATLLMSSATAAAEE